MDPAEENPALVSHFDYHSSPSRQCHPTPTPPTGLKLHFENTNQPLDAYQLTQTYLREYAQGVVDGKLMASKTTSSRSSTTQQPVRVLTTTIAMFRYITVMDPGVFEALAAPCKNRISAISHSITLLLRSRFTTVIFYPFTSPYMVLQHSVLLHLLVIKLE